MEAETPPPRRRDDTRARIRVAALALFAQRGFEGTSMRDVAARVGCTTAALYYHFDGKDALLADLVHPFLDAVEALPADRPATPTELLADYFDVLVGHVEVVRLLQRDLAVQSHPHVRVRYDAHLDRRYAQLSAVVDAASAGATDARVSAGLGALRDPVLRLGPDAAEHRALILEAAVRALGVPAASAS